MTTSISTLAGNTRRFRIGVDLHFVGQPEPGARGRLVALYADAVRRAPEFDFTFFCLDPAQLQALDAAFAMPTVRCVALRRSAATVRLGLWLPLLRRMERVDLLHLNEPLSPIPLLPLGAVVLKLDDALVAEGPRASTRGARWRARLVQAWRAAALWRSVRRAALLSVADEAAAKALQARVAVDPAKLLFDGGPDAATEAPVRAMLAAFKRHFSAHPLR